MTEFEQLVEADREVQKIKKQRDYRLLELDVTGDKQKEQLRKGKPIPVLSMGKQFQNTSKQVNQQHDQTLTRRREIKRQANKEIEQRAELLARENKEIYKIHLMQKQQEKMLEKRNSKEKRRGRGR